MDEREEYWRDLERGYAQYVQGAIDRVAQFLIDKRGFPESIAKPFAEYVVIGQLNCQAQANWRGPV